MLGLVQRGAPSASPVRPARKVVADAVKAAVAEIVALSPRNPPTDAAGAEAAAKQLLQHAHAVLGYQEQAKLRQQFFCEDAKNLDLSKSAQLSNTSGLSM